jgi:hypothetical protein
MRVRHCRALQLALILTLASCIQLGGGAPASGVPGPEGGAPQRGLLRKRVTAKQEPNLLLAADGTSCAVTAERYREINVGDHEGCVWQ